MTQNTAQRGGTNKIDNKEKDIVPISNKMPPDVMSQHGNSVLSGKTSTTQTIRRADFDGHESVAADSLAADSVAATVRTKNTDEPIDQNELASLSLVELIDSQRWRLCMIKVQSEPEHARTRGPICIEGQTTQAYPLHLAVAKKPPVSKEYLRA